VYPGIFYSDSSIVPCGGGSLFSGLVKYGYRNLMAAGGFNRIVYCRIMAGQFVVYGKVDDVFFWQNHQRYRTL
jgi:hypothetical protein